MDKVASDTDDEYIESQTCRCSISGGSDRKKIPSVILSATEQVDEIIDHSIEIESNKRMREENVNLWTLRFKDPGTEAMVLKKYL